MFTLNYFDFFAVERSSLRKECNFTRKIILNDWLYCLLKLLQLSFNMDFSGQYYHLVVTENVSEIQPDETRQSYNDFVNLLVAETVSMHEPNYCTIKLFFMFYRFS